MTIQTLSSKLDYPVHFVVYHANVFGTPRVGYGNFNIKAYSDEKAISLANANRLNFEFAAPTLLIKDCEIRLGDGRWYSLPNPVPGKATSASRLKFYPTSDTLYALNDIVE